LNYRQRPPSPRPLSISPARKVAFEVLERVLEGEYASDELLTRAAPLDSRDAGLASQLVFGVLRYQGQLDFLIEHFGGRTPGQLDQPVLVALRLGIFQLRYLDRVPAHAAVHETVELVKHQARAASGLANAVLRKVNRNPLRWPGKSIELSCPRWLIRKWTTQFGADAAEQIARAALIEPEAYVRIRSGEPLPADAPLEATDVPGCYRVLENMPAGFRQQDIGSQAIVPLLDLAPGQTFLDLCAAPGNKTAQALETPLRAVACDISERRLHDVNQLWPRVVLDAMRPLPFRTKFERVFIDAPCSGTGTLARNPEIKWRVQGRNLAAHQQRQVQILERGLEALTPGGLLVYATCSLEAEENGEVVRAVLSRLAIRRTDRLHDPSVDHSIPVELVSEHWRLPGRDPGDGFYAAVIKSGFYGT
jgi:16S rRNA (cytosine967-C5)-methyltransferase